MFISCILLARDLLFIQALDVVDQGKSEFMCVVSVELASDIRGHIVRIMTREWDHLFGAQLPSSDNDVNTTLCPQAQSALGEPPDREAWL